jgi:hypothetical protein
MDKKKTYIKQSQYDKFGRELPLYNLYTNNVWYHFWEVVSLVADILDFSCYNKKTLFLNDVNIHCVKFYFFFIFSCNKVTCTQCHNSMCWSCSANITSESYQHFRKSVECGMWTFGEGDIPLATKQKPLVCIKYLT